MRKQLQISKPISESFYFQQFAHLLYHFSYVYKPTKSTHLASYSSGNSNSEKYPGYYELA